LSQGGLVTLTATAGAITDADGGTAVSITNTAGQATLTASTGIGSADRKSVVEGKRGATNTGGSSNNEINESDGATVAALQQTNAANGAGTVRLVSSAGNFGLNDGAVLSQGGLVTLTATAGAITDADGGTAVSITNTAGQATLTASTGIGS